MSARWRTRARRLSAREPSGPYDLRSTFASDALAAGVSAFELARVIGTSVEMIERHYETPLDGATARIAGQLDELDARRDATIDQ